MCDNGKGYFMQISFQMRVASVSFIISAHNFDFDTLNFPVSGFKLVLDYLKK